MPSSITTIPVVDLRCVQDNDKITTSCCMRSIIHNYLCPSHILQSITIIYSDVIYYVSNTFHRLCTQRMHTEIPRRLLSDYFLFTSSSIGNKKSCKNPSTIPSKYAHRLQDINSCDILV